MSESDDFEVNKQTNVWRRSQKDLYKCADVLSSIFLCPVVDMIILSTNLSQVQAGNDDSRELRPRQGSQGPR